MLDISVIICAYSEGRWHELVAAITSLRRQTISPKEIIVVVDYNSDLLARVRAQWKNVVALENTEAKGASGARNCGIARAQAEIVAFLDDDAIAQQDWIEKLVACYTEPEIVGVGGKIDPRWQGSRPKWLPAEFYWTIGCSYIGMPTKTTPVRNVIGANMSVRRQILQQVGGFRAAFGNNKDVAASRTKANWSRWLRHQAGDEETELCIRISQQVAGSVWLYTTTAVVEHQVPAQRGRWSYFLWRCYDEGLGKAGLVGLHGAQTGLSSEREYTFKVLPRGILRGLTDALFQRDLSGIMRAIAITLGVTSTIAGYLAGSISARIAVSNKFYQSARRLQRLGQMQRKKVDLGKAVDRV